MGNAFISFVVFLSLLQHFSISEHVDGTNASSLRENLRANPNDFLLVNPKQVHHLEVTIRRFLTKLASPINGSIVLKSTSPQANDLQLTIREICESTRKKLMEFSKDVGLMNTVEQFEKSLRNIPLSEDWYSELMLQNAYMIRDISNMINEIGSSIDYYTNQKNILPQGKKQWTRQENSFTFLGVVHDAAEFSETLTQCLVQLANTRRHKSSFDLNQRIINLTKQPPEIVSKILRSNVNNDSNVGELKDRAWQKPLHVLLCLSLMKYGDNYDDCIREVQNLETCLKSMQHQSSDGSGKMDVRSWTKAIRRLSDCQILGDRTGKTEISCKSARRLPRDIKLKMKYVFERVLDKKISRGSPFHRVSNDLGETLSRSKWGQKFVDELCQYVSIFEDGKTKLKSMSMLKEKDKNAVSRHKEVSEALRAYKRGVLLRTFTSIKKIHRAATDFEKLLAQGVKATFNEAWQGHVNILSSMMEWMTKLLELYSSENDGGEEQSNSQEESNGNEGSNSENLDEFRAIVRPRSAIIKDVDKSMNVLMKSMNQLSKYRKANENSTLTCIANNLLLVTILMETIGFVSTLFCFGQNGSEQISSHIDDEWKRVRRSVLPFEEERIIDFISSESLLFEFNQNSTVPFWNEAD